MDRGSPQDPAVEHHAQQPRLSPGGDVRRGTGKLAQPRTGSGAYRTRLIEPNIDYAMMAKTYRMYGEGPVSDPKDPPSGTQTRRRAGEVGRTRIDRHRDSTPRMAALCWGTLILFL
jgi:hypothetical protein